MKLHELLAASGDTRDHDKRFELWVHPNYDECYQVPLTTANVIKYAGNEVLYFSPDYHRNRGMWISVGVRE